MQDQVQHFIFIEFGLDVLFKETGDFIDTTIGVGIFFQQFFINPAVVIRGLFAILQTSQQIDHVCCKPGIIKRIAVDFKVEIFFYNDKNSINFVIGEYEEMIARVDSNQSIVGYIQKYQKLISSSICSDYTLSNI